MNFSKLYHASNSYFPPTLQYQAKRKSNRAARHKQTLSNLCRSIILPLKFIKKKKSNYNQKIQISLLEII